MLDSSDKNFPNTIDLKMYGTRPFVDAARVYALIYGVRHTNTPERLRGAGEQIGISSEDLTAIVDGFHFIHMLRLRRQMTPGNPPEGANRVNPYWLNQMDRRMLKESFRQARKLQNNLGSRYSI